MLDNQLKNWLKTVHLASKKLVLVTGVFDVLHKEHLKFLQQARAAGDALLVGIESDERVQKLKGEGRPINKQADRVKKLEGLKVADRVFILPEEFDDYLDYSQLVRQIKPAILAVSSHTPKLEIKEQIMKEVGGEVRVVLEHNPEVSTTKIVNGQ